MKRYFFVLPLLCLLRAFLLPAGAEPVDIQGKVTDSATGLPLAGVKVVLLQNGLADTTGSTGEFRLQGFSASVRLPSAKSVSTVRLLAMNRIEFTMDSRQDMSLRVFDMSGRMTAEIFHGNVAPGHYSARYANAAFGRYIYALRIGKQQWCVPFFVLRGRDNVIRFAGAGRLGGGLSLQKKAAFADTILASKPGYKSKRMPVSSAATASFPVQLSAGAGSLTQERPTPEQIGLYFVPSQKLDTLTAVTVRYRKWGESAWHDAHTMLRINPEWIADGAPKAPVNSYAGTIFDLSPAASYEIAVTVSEPGRQAQVFGDIFATRALPAAAPSPTVTAQPTDNLQQKFNALAPGDVLQLADGTYNVSGLQYDRKGTPEKPIYIRGASRAGVVIRDTTGTVLQILKATHVIFENFTLRGSGKDDGTNAGSTGVSFWNGGETQEFVTFRNLAITGVDMGIIGWSAINSVLVYNCTLNGNNVWTKPFIETNLTWNDDGIRLPGEGNCGFENTLNGFGDAFAVTDGVFSAAVYFYRNLVTMTGDDGFEADYATRNIGFYDNHLTNTSTFLSLDPLWGGPLYCFRNISINTVRGPFKLNNTNCGFLIYNNTIIRTDGTTEWGWVQFNNGSLVNWSYRNNILIYRGAGGLLAIESTGNNPIDFTNNAWYPDKSVWWTNSGGSFQALAAARSELPATAPVAGSSARRHENDIIIASNPFVNTIVLGADHLTQVTTTFTPVPATGSNVKNAGVAIPGITDGYSGSNPDMGAIISGRIVPQWGSR